MHLNLTLERLRLESTVIGWLRQQVHDAFTTSVARLRHHFCRGLVRPQVKKHIAFIGWSRRYLGRRIVVGDLQIDVFNHLLVAIGCLSRFCGDASRIRPLIFAVVLLV